MAIPLTGTLVPSGDFPALDDNYLKGSYQIVQTITDRDNIPALRRKFGMMVYVIDQQKLFVLKQINSDQVNDNTNWVEKKSSTGKCGEITNSGSLSNDLDPFGDGSQVIFLDFDNGIVDPISTNAGYLNDGDYFSGFINKCAGTLDGFDRNDTIELQGNNSSLDLSVLSGDQFTLSFYYKYITENPIPSFTGYASIFTYTSGYDQTDCGNYRRELRFPITNGNLGYLEYIEYPSTAQDCTELVSVQFPCVPEVKWRHICVVKDGVNVTIYSNAIACNTISNAHTGESGQYSTCTLLGKGGSNNETDVRSPGFIDQLRIFNRTLNEDEVKQIAGV